MDLELVDNKDYLLKFRNYLSFYLKGSIEYQHLNPKDGKINFNSKIHFYNYDVDTSIYYFKNDGFYYFGLGKEISDIVNLKAHTKIVAHLDYHIKVKDAIHFAKDEFNNIFLVMPINSESLSDKEIFSLKDTNDIIEIDNDEYINFGELKRDIYILRNIRNFMDHINVDTQYTNFLKLKKVSVINKFLKNPNFCSSCDNLISKSYINNEIIKDFVGNYPDICADCYSKLLMDYFLSMATDIFLNRYYLELLAENSSDIKFYLNLFVKYGMFDKYGFLERHSTKKTFVPPKYQLNPHFFQTMESYNEFINKKTMINEGDELSDFEIILLKNNLSYSEGFHIKKQLKDYVFSGKIRVMGNKTLISIDKKLKMLIKEKTNSKKSAQNIFEIIEILNKLTLNSKGELNNEFKNHVSSFGLDEDVCWKIRDTLIERIENQIIKKQQLLTIFNKTSDEIIQQEIYKLYTKKECYCLKNSIYLNAILNQSELIDLVKNLNSIKSTLEINNFNLINMNNNLFKIFLDFKVINMDILNDFLNDRGFNKKLLYCNEGVD